MIDEIEHRTSAHGKFTLKWPGRDGRLEMALYSHDSGFFEVETTSLGVFEVDRRNQRIGVPAGAEPIRREMLCFGTPLALLISGSGDLPLHGAAFVSAAGVVVIIGHGGSGKSTLTAAALASGVAVLSDDLIRVRTESPAVHFGPAVIRIREPSLKLLDLTAVNIITTQAGKTHLAATAGHQAAGPLPLAAIAILRSGSALVVNRVPPNAALPELWKQSFYLPDQESRAVCFQSLGALVDRVPVFELRYPHRPDVIEPALAILSSLGASK